MGIQVGSGGPLGSTMIRDTDGGGNYLLNDQTTTNMMSKGTVYRFDGTDDNVNTGANAEVANIFDGGGFFCAKIYPVSDGENDFGRIGSKKDGWGILCLGESSGFIKLRFYVDFDGTDGYWDLTSAIIPISDWTNVVISYNSNDVANNPTVYLNGIPYTVGSGLTEGGTPVGTRIDDTANSLYIGNNAAGTGTFDGEIGEVMLGNFAPTAAEVRDLISGNIPFKWQYGSQVAKEEDAMAVDGTGNWTQQDISLAFDTDHYVATYVADTQWMQLSSPYTVVAGKEYRVSLDIKDGATTGVDIGIVLDKTTAVVSGTSSATWQTITMDWVAPSSGVLWIGTNLTAAGDYQLRNYSVVELGAVALYDQDSISETYWYDKANGNDGAVTGAEVLNAPSVTSLSAMHTQYIALEPGATPGTNINCTDKDRSNWNQLALTDGTNIAKSGSSGSFALDAGGTLITVTTPKQVVGILGVGVRIHDVNSSSTSEMYIPDFNYDASGNLTIAVRKRGATATVDMTTILDAGDFFEVWVQYVTAT